MVQIRFFTANISCVTWVSISPSTVWGPRSVGTLFARMVSVHWGGTNGPVTDLDQGGRAQCLGQVAFWL